MMFVFSIDFFIVVALLLFVSMAVSLGLTRFMIALLQNWGIVDKPDFKRHIHTIATPRGGGIGMVVCFFAVVLIFFFLYSHAREMTGKVIGILIPLGILFPLGILDDKLGIVSGIKFLFQILTAGLAWYLGVRMTSIFGLELSTQASCVITVFWIVAFINAFNMIDGVDGLASGIACISAFSLAFIAWVRGGEGIVYLLVIFMGSLLGFLYFNWHPARVFMGDTGSMFIGYLLSVTGILLNAHLLSIASIGVPLLACGVPVLDIFLAVWRRLFNPAKLKAIEERGNNKDVSTSPLTRRCFCQQAKELLKRLGTADRRHIHHRFLNAFDNNQIKAVQRIYIIAGIMGVIAIVCAMIPGQGKFLAITLIVGTFSIMISRLATLELWNSAEVVFHNFHSARIGLLLSHVIHPVFDLSVIAVVSYCANIGTVLGIPSYLIEHIAIIMIVMLFSHNYRTFWNYSVTDDYFRLLATLALGYFISWLTSGLVFGQIPGERFLAGAGVVIVTILAERLSLHYIRNYVIERRNNTQLMQEYTLVSTVIVGINSLARHYRERLSTSLRDSEKERILGLVTADRRYLHSFCYGMKVLATIDALDSLYQKKPFQKLVLTFSPNAEVFAGLQKFCQDRSISIVSFVSQENSI